MEVIYNVSFENKDNVIVNEEELKDIITRKLLKVILNLENSMSIAVKSI